MPGTKRRKFTAEFRSQVVLEVLSRKLTVPQVAEKYKIKDSAIYYQLSSQRSRRPGNRPQSVFNFCLMVPNDRGQFTAS
jgi:transposase-like protein